MKKRKNHVHKFSMIHFAWRTLIQRVSVTVCECGQQDMDDVKVLQQTSYPLRNIGRHVHCWSENRLDLGVFCIPYYDCSWCGVRRWKLNDKEA